MNCSHCAKEMTAPHYITDRGSNLCGLCTEWYENMQEKVAKMGFHPADCSCSTCQTDFIQSF